MAQLSAKAVPNTGGAPGSGEAISRRFATDGARVTIADIDETTDMAEHRASVAVAAETVNGRHLVPAISFE